MQSAKDSMKVHKGIQSGTLGATVSVNSKYGQVIRSRPRRPRRDTNARRLVRQRCSYYAQLWRTLTDEQQDGWTALGRQTPCASSDQPGAHPHGCQMLVKINCALEAAGLPPVKDAPKRVKLGLNPVKRLHATRQHGEFKLELELDRTPKACLLVLGSRPCSAGIRVRNTYAIIGLLRAPKRGRIDITGFYVKKFGTPAPDTRVFIRTRQILNGWQDDALDVHARVPKP